MAGRLTGPATVGNRHVARFREGADAGASSIVVAMHDRSRPPADPGGGVDFDRVIDDVLDALPDTFLERLGSVAIVVEDEASHDQLASVGAPGLFGLYQGVPRTRFGVDNVPLPSKITLFRGPLTRANRDPERLRTAIANTLLHEIAHHFGIDDDRLRELWAAGEATRAGGGRGLARG